MCYWERRMTWLKFLAKIYGFQHRFAHLLMPFNRISQSCTSFTLECKTPSESVLGTSVILVLCIIIEFCECTAKIQFYCWTFFLITKIFCIHILAVCVCVCSCWTVNATHKSDPITTIIFFIYGDCFVHFCHRHDHKLIQLMRYGNAN